MDDRRFSERIVFGALAVALVLGIGIYNVIPISSPSDEPATPAVVPTTTTSVAPAGEEGDAAVVTGSGGTFGSAIAALQSQRTADQVVADAAATETLVPGPSCPTDVVAAAADDARARVSDVLGVAVPGSGLGDLAAIAAGCSNADATGPLLAFALELGALTTTAPAARPAGAAPTTAAAPPVVTVPGAVAVATTAAPTPTATAAPAVDVVPLGLPAGLADALVPEADAIRAGCADVGFLSVLVASVPGAAVEVYGADAATAVAQATALCALLDA